jgi:type VI protein secretion system component Hcp
LHVTTSALRSRFPDRCRHGRASIKPLVKAAFTGQHFQTATLQVGTTRTAVLFSIELHDVIVIDVKHEFSTGGPGARDDSLMESITLDSASLSFTSGGVTVQCSQVTNSCQ